jgi:hypothetical protein
VLEYGVYFLIVDRLSQTNFKLSSALLTAVRSRIRQKIFVLYTGTGQNIVKALVKTHEIHKANAAL